MEKQNEKKGIGAEILQGLKSNVRDYMMYIALVVIMIFFTWKTNGGFIQARNIANLWLPFPHSPERIRILPWSSLPT